MKLETADRQGRLSSPKHIRTRLRDLPPGKALGSRLVDGERVWRVVPATQTAPPPPRRTSSNRTLAAAQRRTRRALAKARRDQTLSRMRAAIRKRKRPT